MTASERNAERVLAEAERSGWTIRRGHVSDGVLVAERDGTRRYGSDAVGLAQTLATRQRRGTDD